MSAFLRWGNTELHFSIPTEQGVKREEALKELGWIIGCWQFTIQKSYMPDAPRMIEIKFKTEQILAELKRNLNFEEFEEIESRLRL
jgi:hypothetical protein